MATKVHSFKSCFFAALCEDPCNQSAVNVDKRWRDENPKYHPAIEVERCSLLGRCRMVPGSARCYRYRCPECKVWVDKAMEEEKDTTTDIRKLMLFHKMLAGRIGAPDDS